VPRSHARRSVPRACRLWSPSTVDPGRSNPQFLPDSVPNPARGLLTPRVSPPLSAPRSHARSHSSDALDRRSERRHDRSLMARLIRRLDERAADAWILSCRDQRGTGGGTQGGTPPPREVFPSKVPDFARITVDASALRHATASANFNRRCELLNACGGRRSVPPVVFAAVSEGSIAVPWRERPPFWPPWPAKPAASEVVAHATLSVSQPERSSSDSCIERALNPRRSTSRSSAVAQ
jgi:hypothetical protein